MLSTSNLSTSTHEAFRLTSRPASELLHTLGPHGVDELIRQMLAACWRDSAPEGRTYKSVQALARLVFDRNLRVWNAIKKPSPAAFFENLLPNPADGYARQAFVMCWMMLPRGKRAVADVARAMTHIFGRNLASWDEDYQMFTKGFGPVKRKPATVKKVVKIPKKPAKRRR